jgi:four helix bundle protein
VYRTFNDTNDFNFREQIQRATLSVMNNIAEGFERRTNNEFKHFLFMAKGSCGEVRSMLYAALDLKKITEEIFRKLYELSVEICRILSGLIKTL